MYLTFTFEIVLDTNLYINSILSTLFDFYLNIEYVIFALRTYYTLSRVCIHIFQRFFQPKYRACLCSQRKTYTWISFCSLKIGLLDLICSLLNYISINIHSINNKLMSNIHDLNDNFINKTICFTSNKFKCT